MIRYFKLTTTCYATILIRLSALSKVTINAEIATGQFRIATVSHDTLDGSVYITLNRENENTSGTSQSLNTSDMSFSPPKVVENINKIVKISCHTSGFIKYHNLSTKRLFNEPLYEVTKPFLLVEYLVKDLNLLLKSTDKKSMIKLPEKNSDAFYSFSFFIFKNPDPDSFCINYYGGLFFICMKINVVERLDIDKKMFYIYLSPTVENLRKEQKNSACILFHQKINDTNEVIVYKPNKTGVYTMIFNETRRSVPKKVNLIKLSNPEYRIEYTSVKPHYAKFFIYNKRNGNKVIEDDISIETITFDNRLGDNLP
jgi:hypothetical protein